jgi:cysteine synthase A
MPKRWIIFDLLTDEGLCWADRPGSTSPGQSAWRAKWGRARPSSPSCATAGSRYQSKLYNPTFLREKGLPVPEWLDRSSRAIPAVFEDA